MWCDTLEYGLMIHCDLLEEFGEGIFEARDPEMCYDFFADLADAEEYC